MAAQLEIFEQRIGKLERSIRKILTLLKELSARKEGEKDDVSNDEINGEKGSNNEEEKEGPKVVFVTPSQGEKVKEEETKMLSKMKMLEENVRAIQGIDAYGRLEMQDFCLFPKIEISAKFKVPDFAKFEGKIDPVIHLTMYARSMVTYLGNEKLMIHCFQHNLTSGALT